MEIITTAIIKGGTGKTTTAAAIAQAAAADHKKVLAIDLDPQANLTYVLAADPRKPGAYHLLHNADTQEVIQATKQQIDVISGHPDLSAETTKTGSARRLINALTPIKKNYDLIIIDTPPAMNELTFNALQAATGVIIPVLTDAGSMQGFNRITEITQHMQQSNPNLSFIGIILTRFDRRPKINRHLRNTIIEKAAKHDIPYLGEIRQGIAITEAQALQLSLYTHAPKSKPAADYWQLYKAATRTRD